MPLAGDLFMTKDNCQNFGKQRATNRLTKISTVHSNTSNRLKKLTLFKRI